MSDAVDYEKSAWPAHVVWQLEILHEFERYWLGQMNFSHAALYGRRIDIIESEFDLTRNPFHPEEHTT